jgi:hypothetical protein
MDISSDLAGSGHASAFYRYTGVDDFVAVAASLYSPRIFLLAILRKSMQIAVR